MIRWALPVLCVGCLPRAESPLPTEGPSAILIAELNGALAAYRADSAIALGLSDEHSLLLLDYDVELDLPHTQIPLSGCERAERIYPSVASPMRPINFFARAYRPSGEGWTEATPADLAPILHCDIGGLSMLDCAESGGCYREETADGRVCGPCEVDAPEGASLPALPDAPRILCPDGWTETSEGCVAPAPSVGTACPLGEPEAPASGTFDRATDVAELQARLAGPPLDYILLAQGNFQDTRFQIPPGVTLRGCGDDTVLQGSVNMDGGALHNLSVIGSVVAETGVELRQLRVEAENFTSGIRIKAGTSTVVLTQATNLGAVRHGLLLGSGAVAHISDLWLSAFQRGLTVRGASSSVDRLAISDGNVGITVDAGGSAIIGTCNVTAGRPVHVVGGTLHLAQASLEGTTIGADVTEGSIEIEDTFITGEDGILVETSSGSAVGRHLALRRVRVHSNDAGLTVRANAPVELSLSIHDLEVRLEGPDTEGIIVRGAANGELERLEILGATGNALSSRGFADGSGPAPTLRIEDFSASDFQQFGEAGQHGMVLQGDSRTVVDRAKVEDALKSGIYADQGAWLDVSNLVVINGGALPGAAALRMESASTSTRTQVLRQVEIHGCVEGLRLRGPSEFAVEDLTITDCDNGLVAAKTAGRLDVTRFLIRGRQGDDGSPIGNGFDFVEARNTPHVFRNGQLEGLAVGMSGETTGDPSHVLIRIQYRNNTGDISVAQSSDL